MIDPQGSGAWGDTPSSHWTMKRTAAAVGIVVQLGMGLGPAWAQNQTVATPPGSNGGVTLPGVPSTPVSHVADSVGGVTQATSANRAMTCGTGMVLSGGTCVPLPTPTPPPNCAYGTVWSGGSCVPIGNFTPPPTNCPSGQVLSGGNCVPLPTVPSTCPATQPVNTQYLNCPSGQTGSIVQTRSVQCDASTNWQWTTGTWSTSSNTCVVAPAPTPPATPCPAIYQTWGAACYGYSPAGSPGTQTSVPNANGSYTGAATYQCNNGTWSYMNGSCNGGTPPPSCNSQTVSWSSCSGSVGGAVHGGFNYPTNSTGGFTGNATFQCNAGTWTYVNGSCNPAPTPTCPASRPSDFQSVSCPSGQTGSIVQTRTVQCNAGTGWQWITGSWTNSSNTCTPVQAPPPPQCQAHYGLAWQWGSSNQCSGTINVGPTPSGQSYTLTGNLSTSFYRFNCVNGSWEAGGDFCPQVTSPQLGCASQGGWLRDSSGQATYSWHTVPATQSGNSVNVPSLYIGQHGASWATFCDPGAWSCNNGTWNNSHLCVYGGGY